MSKKSKKARKTYRFQMTSLSLCFWAFCLFFLLSWIFVLGIFVGRGLLPGGVHFFSELKGQMDKLQAAVTPGKPASSRPEDKENEDPKLAFYERLSSKKNEVRMRAEPPREIPMKEKPAEAHRREAANKPPAPAQPRTSAGDHLQYTVQLASMGEKVRADAVIKDLRDRGYEAYMTEAVVGGKVYYRVRCGRFTTQEEAGKHARKLAKEAGLKGFVSRIE